MISSSPWCTLHHKNWCQIIHQLKCIEQIFSQRGTNTCVLIFRLSDILAHHQKPPESWYTAEGPFWPSKCWWQAPRAGSIPYLEMHCTTICICPLQENWKSFTSKVCDRILRQNLGKSGRQLHKGALLLRQVGNDLSTQQGLSIEEKKGWDATAALLTKALHTTPQTPGNA